jgi:hypothetical protein
MHLRPLVRFTGLLLVVALVGAGCAGFRSLVRPDPIESGKRSASKLRGLEFIEPVNAEWIPSSDIPELARSEVEAFYEPEFVEAYRDAYAVLGLLPRDIDLLEVVIELQGDQLVGLYSVSRKTLYVVVNRPGETGPRVILIHELVHSLQHQHFPTTVSVLQGVRHNDDVATAIGGAVEGDATLTMLAAEAKGSKRREAYRSMKSAEGFRDAMLVDLDNPTGLLENVPHLLRVSLIAPYAYGVVLAADRYQEGGNAGLDQLLTDPPLATVLLLYPEEQDAIEFISYPLEWLEAQVRGDGCSLGHNDVAGALTLRVMFEEFSPEIDVSPWLRAWRGDRFLHVRCPEEDRLVWLTRWDDPPSAQAFGDAYAGIAAVAAERAGLPDPPEVVSLGRSTMIVSPSLRALTEGFIDRIEIRSYRTFSDWIADDCFTEDGCADPVTTASRLE